MSKLRASKSAASLGSPFSSPRGKYSMHSERSPTYASHSLHGGTPGNWQGGRCIACAQGIAHSSLEAAVRAKKLLQLEAELEAERGAKVKAELTQARSDAELRRSERERSERELAAKSVQLSESVQLSSFPSESAARRAAQESCVPCRSPSPSARQEPAEEEEELHGTRAAHEQKGVQLSEGKLSDQLEAALASALLELKEARAELRKQRDRSEESKSAAEESQQESLRLQRRSSRAEAEAEELREQLRAARAEQQTLRLRCTAAEEELLAQGSAARITGRTQQAHVPHACAPHVHRMCTACAPHAHRMRTKHVCMHKARVHAPSKFHCRSSPQLLVGGACPHYLCPHYLP